MKRTVLIVSSNASYMDKLSDIVKEVKEEVAVYTATGVGSAYELLMDITMDVFLLDVALFESIPGDTSGLRLAERIRQIPKYMLTPLILIAPVKDPELYAYTELNCLGYFNRPYSTEQLKYTLSKALHYRTKRDEDKLIVFRGHGCLHPVKANELVFIINEDHILKLHLSGGEVREMAYKSLAALLLEADVDCLLQCSRSVIINKNYIESIDVARHCIELTGNRGRVAIGFTYRKKIVGEFYSGK